MRISESVKELPVWSIATTNLVRASSRKEAIDQLVLHDTDNIKRRVLEWEGIVTHSHDDIHNLNDLHLEDDDVVFYCNPKSQTKRIGLVYADADGELFVRWLKGEGSFVSLKLLQSDMKLNGFHLQKV